MRSSARIPSSPLQLLFSEMLCYLGCIWVFDDAGEYASASASALNNFLNNKSSEFHNKYIQMPINIDEVQPNSSEYASTGFAEVVTSIDTANIACNAFHRGNTRKI